MAQSKNFVLAICGGSGSGKTTYAQKLMDYLGQEKCLFLGLDNYYKDQSAKFSQDKDSVNFDHPDSLDFPLFVSQLKDLKENKKVLIPEYDFVTHTRVTKEKGEYTLPRPIIIVDGILILSQKEILSLIDYSIFLDIDTQTRFLRRLKRDVEHRGRSEECVTKQFQEQVHPMHEQFVSPGRKIASIVFDNNQLALEHMDEIAKMIKNFQGK